MKESGYSDYKVFSSDHRQLLVCSLNQLINDQLSSEGDSPTFPQIVNALERIADNVIIMIDGDFHVLISGIFRKVGAQVSCIVLP